MMFWTDHDLSGWGWVAMATGMVVFWGLLIALVVILVRSLDRPADPPTRPDRGPRRSNCSASAWPAARSTRPSTGVGGPR